MIGGMVVMGFSKTRGYHPKEIESQASVNI
jgi:hypothetical protein